MLLNKEFINKYNNQLFLLLSALIGAFVFVYFFGVQILDPEYVEWIYRGDRMQHYIGSMAFRSDEWHFPITKTTMIAYPEGISIVYTDSNPLLSTIFKVLRPIFPAHYQFFGMWFAFSWILQAVLSYSIVNKLTKDKYSALFAAAIFCLFPTMYNRLPHTNLIALWVVLWAIYLYINEGISLLKREALFFLVFTVGMLIHGYIGMMTLFVGGTWFLQRGIKFLMSKEFKSLGGLIGRFSIYFALFIGILWCFGFFYNAPVNEGAMGFGHYSMNILSPFNPVKEDFSIFFTPTPSVRGQAFEGFQYLGMGIILLYLFTLILGLKNQLVRTPKATAGLLIGILVGAIALCKFLEVPAYNSMLFCAMTLFCIVLGRELVFEKLKDFVFLYYLGIFCIVLALSHYVYLGDVRILRYDIFNDGIGLKFFQTIRSSGRFFWVSNIIMLLASICLIQRNLKKKTVCYFILLTFLQYQMIDLMGVKKITKEEVSPGLTYTPTQKAQAIFAESKYVDLHTRLKLYLSLFAIRNNVAINSFYMAHGDGAITKERLSSTVQNFDNNVGEVNDSTLYFIKKSKSWATTTEKKLVYYPYEPHPYIIEEDLFIAISENHPYAKRDTDPKITQLSGDLREVLGSIDQKKMVMISVKDEASEKLPVDFVSKVDSTYGTTLSQLNNRTSYIALFVDGKLVQEYRRDLGEGEELKDAFKVEDKDILLLSAFTKSSIIINGQDYSRNMRGLNIVSLDSTGNYSSLYFDTYANEY